MILSNYSIPIKSQLVCRWPNDSVEQLRCFSVASDPQCSTKPEAINRSKYCSCTESDSTASTGTCAIKRGTTRQAIAASITIVTRYRSSLGFTKYAPCHSSFTSLARRRSQTSPENIKIAWPVTKGVHSHGYCRGLIDARARKSL